MKTEKLIEAKEVGLKNNCPVCYSNKGLRLTFKQKIIETKLYKSLTSDISNEINCTKCNSVIYPAQWTDDIDRVFEYHQKAFVPKNHRLTLKNCFG